MTIVGIDLGISHTVMAWAESDVLADGAADDTGIRLFEVDRLNAQPLPPIATVLKDPVKDDGGSRREITVELLSDFTEVGTLELQAQGDDGQRPPHLVPGGEDDMLRLGAALERVPVAHKVEIGAWLQPLLALDWKRLPEAAFAAAQLGRLTGDRARDIDADLRLQLIARLDAAQAPQSWVAMLREPLALDGADQRQLWGQMLGEALPPGLRLIVDIDH